MKCVCTCYEYTVHMTCNSCLWLMLHPSLNCGWTDFYAVFLLCPYVTGHCIGLKYLHITLSKGLLKGWIYKSFEFVRISSTEFRHPRKSYFWHKRPLSRLISEVFKNLSKISPLRSVFYKFSTKLDTCMLEISKIRLKISEKRPETLSPQLI